MARPRKPTAMKKREGRRYAGEPPCAKRACPEAPATIKADPAYRAKWREICDWLDQLGVLTVADRDAIAVCTVAACDFYAALKMCKEKGRYGTNSYGNACVQPWVKELRESMHTWLKVAPRLGLTVCDREKLAGLVKQDDGTEDELEGMIKIA